jgi:hypothetical protein
MSLFSFVLGLSTIRSYRQRRKEMQKSVNRENVNLNCQRVHLITRHGCQKGVGNGPIAIRESILSNGGYLNLFIFFVCGILNSHVEMRKILRRYGKFCGKKVMGKNGEF